MLSLAVLAMTAVLERSCCTGHRSVEIATVKGAGKAQRYLREWYGVHHDPVLSQESRKMIEVLERTPAGAQFDPVFLRTFSNHHLSALGTKLVLPSEERSSA